MLFCPAICFFPNDNEKQQTKQKQASLLFLSYRMQQSLGNGQNTLVDTSRAIHQIFQLGRRVLETLYTKCLILKRWPIFTSWMEMILLECIGSVHQVWKWLGFYLTYELNSKGSLHTSIPQSFHLPLSFVHCSAFISGMPNIYELIILLTLWVMFLEWNFAWY